MTDLKEKIKKIPIDSEKYKKFKHFTYEAVEDILKHSTRLVGCKNKLSTDFNKLLEIITEADIFAKIENKEFVEKKHVKKAIYEKHKRLSKIENKMDEYIQNNTIMIKEKLVFNL